MLFSRYAPCLVAVMLACTAMSAQSALPETVDELTKDWLMLERQLQSLESQWQLDKPVLEQRIALLRQQREQLQNLLAQAKNQNTRVDEQRQSLLAEQAQLEQQQQQTERVVRQLAAQINQQRAALPAPLRKAIPALTPSSNSDPSKPSNAAPNVTEQLQRLTSALQQMAQFKQRMSIHQGIIQINQQRMLVDQLYAGYDYAWFVNQDNSQSGYGQAIDGEWQWHLFTTQQANPEAIRQAIDILQNKALADYIALPIALDRSPANGGAQ